MSSLTKLGAALTAVFAVSIVALAAQILWVLLRSRKFRQRSLAGGGGGGGRGDHESAAAGAVHPPSSKELLYFFCWKNQSRVEPAAAAGARTVVDDPDNDDDDGDALVKWQGLYGPPRLLFTIKEEEREDAVDSDCGSNAKSKSGSSSWEKIDDKKRVCLRECLAEADDEAPPGEAAVGEAAAVVLEVEEEEGEGEGTTPFSTPCASPPYFTPSPSPARDDRLAEVPTTVVVVLDGQSQPRAVDHVKRAGAG